MKKIFFIIIFISLFLYIKNASHINYNNINITEILSYKYIFIHYPWNKHSQIIYKLLKEISPNNLIIIDLIHISNPELFFKNLSKCLNNNSNKNINLNINIPLLIKSYNNHYDIYNNNPNIKKMKNFFDININSHSSDNKVFTKINYDFLYEVFFSKKDCLIIFYIKNKKSKFLLKKIISELKQKLNINICIAYTDITNKYSYKLFNIVDGYENDLPFLRYIKFINHELFFTKKNNIDLLDKNITYKLTEFIHNSINKKLFYHEYQDKKMKKYYSYINIYYFTLYINNICF